jgi:alpha-tubulin suppressor-like RCC1 family protein
MSDGTVVAWGSNIFGELGNGSTSSNSLPAPVPGLSGIRDVDAGANVSFALGPDGTVLGWGWSFGLTPTSVQGLSGVTAIAAGSNYIVALLQDGTVRTVYQSTVENPGLYNVVGVSASPYYCVALQSNTLVWAWSPTSLPYQALGSTPVQVPFPNPAILGRGGCSGISMDGTVKVWWAENGWMSPGCQVPVLHGVVAVDVVNSAGIALKSDGTVWIWMQLVYYDQYMHPAVIQFNPGPGLNPAFTPARGVSGGGSHVLVLRTP